MFLVDHSYLSSIREAISEAGKMDIAVAFWGAGSEELFKGVTAEIRLICNLSTGGTNPEPISLLRTNENIRIRQSALLHAKVLITDTLAIIGSANFSTNGLHYEGEELRGWSEAGALCRESSVVSAAQRWFDDLWDASDPISDADMSAATSAWKKARRYRSIASTGTTDRLPTRAEMTDRNVYVVTWSTDASNEAERQIAQVKRAERGRREDASELDYYEDWSELPKDASLIDVYIGPKGGVSVRNVYRRVPSLDRSFQRKDGTSGTIQVVSPEATERELPFKWNSALRTVLKKKLAARIALDPDSDHAMVIPLADLL